MTKQNIDAYISGLATKDGQLTPEMVVADAKRKSSPLHQYFEWDDKKAGHMWRLDTARALIRGVRVATSVESVQLRAVVFVRDPRRAPNDAGYVRARDLKRDIAAARDAVLSEFDRAVSAMQRARDVAGVLGQTGMIEGLIADLTTGKAKVAAA